MVKRRAGFSLLEALVALAVAASALTLLLSVLRHVAVQEDRTLAGLGSARLQANALVLLEDLNPMATSVGALRLPPRGSLAWSSRRLTPIRRNTVVQPGDGDFDVALYAVDVRITDAAGRAAQPFTFNRVGWARVRGAH